MIWLIGAGHMATDYVDVLKKMNVHFQVIGRSEKNAQRLQKEKEISVQAGGLATWLAQQPELPEAVIVAVDVDDLYETTHQLITYGVQKILIEKPGGINFEEISHLNEYASAKSCAVYIAYNRRFYASVIEAKRRIEQDGGVSSFHFEFTEWSDAIGGLPKSSRCKENWLLANSSHVIDLAFFIGGQPENFHAYQGGQSRLQWHPQSAIYTGAGVTETGAFFSYCANWDAPGRWSLEFMTEKNRYVFRPMEVLQVQERNSVHFEEVQCDYSRETDLKSGLCDQVHGFLQADVSPEIMRLGMQVRKQAIYDTILHGGVYVN
ncbi:Gfo/Idh/MocA family oxidoreductase [Algicola sagamiensis]|uniref:Gfo/Idh/MocA family oxidoreductase n=1 Tax=Algicola sagamiensis TaxID=163869 RepID=UPI00037A33B7|nr:Gfo/Idh/MocA family oxidoreductase [Algicola sagamiensis]